MPRPTLAQLASGSVTVVGSTLAMLLLSQVSSGPGVVVITLAGLALGVMVALTLAAPRDPRTIRRRPDMTAPQATLTLTNTGSSAEPQLSKHSLRR